jgi:glycine/serine hydroxymethyltransferase
MGSPALTSRGFIEEDFDMVAEFVDRAVNIALAVKQHSGPKLKDFKESLDKEVRAEKAGLADACAAAACLLCAAPARRCPGQPAAAAAMAASAPGPCGAEPAPALLPAQIPAELKQLKLDVEAFAMQFPTIGFEKGEMRYKN